MLVLLLPPELLLVWLLLFPVPFVEFMGGGTVELPVEFVEFVVLFWHVARLSISRVNTNIPNFLVIIFFSC